MPVTQIMMHDDSETGEAVANLLSESLTIYDTDKKVAVHCHFVFRVIIVSKRSSVRSIAGHGGEMK